MKKSLLLLLLIGNVGFLNAQDIQHESNAWFDFKIAQFFGFNDWNRVKFASDRLPNTSFSTDLRVGFNVYIVRPVGFFCDMGVGIMPAPRDGFADPAVQATLSTGIPYYTKEMTVENGYQTTSGNFKMTFGLFGKIPAIDGLSVLPYFGVGFATISAPTCEAILKEHDTNMQYIARYQWFDLGEYNKTYPLTYLAFRLRFAYHISPKINLLFGIEYALYPERLNFSETYTNYFNRNITKTIDHEGNRLNMLGFSLGISFNTNPVSKIKTHNIFGY